METSRWGRYRARFAETDADIRRALRLRDRMFRGAPEDGGEGPRDGDGLDAACDHVLVEERESGTLVCCFRLLGLRDGAEVGESYAALSYDLSPLESFDRPMAEMGRFCIAPERRHPDILRVAWAAVARFVDRHGIEMLFGCSSFKGTDAARHAEALALLTERHLAPARWLPRVKAPRVVRLRDAVAGCLPDRRRAMQGMPPLLRSYLAMGGRVSDHAVIDRDLDTLHVFTGLEIRAIPPERARTLRAAAG